MTESERELLLCIGWASIAVLRHVSPKGKDETDDWIGENLLAKIKQVSAENTVLQTVKQS